MLSERLQNLTACFVSVCWDLENFILVCVGCQRPFDSYEIAPIVGLEDASFGPHSLYIHNFVYVVELRKPAIAALTILQARSSSIPLGGFGRPEELGDLVTFLASEKNSYVTGTTILVDGGVVRSVL